jgi:hypothetical protein
VRDCPIGTPGKLQGGNTVEKITTFAKIWKEDVDRVIEDGGER